MTNQKEIPELSILSQYIKDLSCEAPNSPEIFFSKEQIQANVNMNIDIKVNNLKDNLYNVNIILKLHNTYGDDKKTIFLIELTYGGVVGLNMDLAKHEKTLLTTVPLYLFPHIRAVISRITTEAGFPLNLAPVDFEGMYNNNKGNKIH